MSYVFFERNRHDEPLYGKPTDTTQSLWHKYFRLIRKRTCLVLFLRILIDPANSPARQTLLRAGKRHATKIKASSRFSSNPAAALRTNETTQRQRAFSVRSCSHLHLCLHFSLVSQSDKLTTLSNNTTMIPDQQQSSLFSSLSASSFLTSSSSMSKTSDHATATPIIRRSASSSTGYEAAAVFGWGDFPVVNEEYIAASSAGGAFPFYSSTPSSSFSRCDAIDKQQEWSSTPPSYALASSSWRKRYSSSSSSSSPLSNKPRPTLHQHHESDDSSPNLALSLVSDDDDDDDDTASNYSDESAESAVSTAPTQQHSTQTASTSTTNGNKQQQQQQQQRHVHFANVTVQEHELVLGDHPWAGPYPLAIGWQHAAARAYTMDDYERERNHHAAGRRRRRARSRGELPRRLSAVERCQRLWDVTGCSLEFLQELEKKRQHEQENQTYPMCDNDDEGDENDQVNLLCYHDKMRQLPADFHTTIVPPHQRRRNCGTLRFF
jgi:hypothetical protein